LFELLAIRGRRMFLLHALPLVLRFIVVGPCLVACHDSFQDTGIFFIALEKSGRNIYLLLLMLSCKLFGHPLRTTFMVPQVIMHYGLARSITRANVSRRSSLVKVSTLWMCWSVRDVDGRPGRLSSVTLVLPSIKRSIHS
jgi:hypothetical protein